jgi:hypothetical protein
MYLSQRTKDKIPRAINVIAPRTWASAGAFFGKQNEITIHNKPIPKAVSALHPKVRLKSL